MNIWPGAADLWKGLGRDQKILLAGATCFAGLAVSALIARNIWHDIFILAAAPG